MKLAIACAMLFAFFGPSASASDERGLAVASTPNSSMNALSSSSSASSPNSAASSSGALTASAKPIALPDAPSPTDPLLVAPISSELSSANALLAPPAALIKLKPQPRTHSFFDARNTFGLASLGVSLTADALSTQKGLAYPGFTEMNPIARPFVQTRMGAAAYNAGSFGLLAGLMYWAHRTEHHKLERILPFAVGGWEGLLSARNYHVIASRPR